MPFHVKLIAGTADPDVQRNAGSGESDHYNVRTTFAFGEGETKMDFIEHGILLSDGSKCFLKGLKVSNIF